MGIKKCPRCSQLFTFSDDCKDYVHQCNSGSDALDNEDIVKKGPFTDYSGSGNEPTSQTFRRGMLNELTGVSAADGKRFLRKTARGATAVTHRTRPHEQFIDLN